MPNWAQGNIRIRGKRQNIIRYLQEQLITVYPLRDNNDEERPIIIEEEFGGYQLRLIRSPETTEWFCFKDGNRQFITCEDDSYSVVAEISEDAEHTKEDQVLFLDGFKGAWAIDVDYFKKAAFDYKVDIRVFVWERGMQWSSVSTFFRDGRMADESQTYADWLWESALPNYGG